MSTLPSTGARVAIYGRVSSCLWTSTAGEDQRDLCQEYAERQGWKVVESYFDATESDVSLIDRDELFRMLAAASNGEFSLVLTRDLDCISGSASLLHTVVEDLESLGVGLCTVRAGMACLATISCMANREGREIDERARCARARSAVLVRAAQ